MFVININNIFHWKFINTNIETNINSYHLGLKIQYCNTYMGIGRVSDESFAFKQYSESAFFAAFTAFHQHKVMESKLLQVGLKTAWKYCSDIIK